MLWQVNVQVLEPWLYVTGNPPFGATTFMSKLTSRCPEAFALLDPTPCAVWQVEQVNPALMCDACFEKLAFSRIFPRLWHFAHIA